ncbi:MAG TPA: hypothetical protein VJY62_13090 [Bacteroidia bacterium]|nr:hypothetical protein [Bacteroidia bacterium]
MADIFDVSHSAIHNPSWAVADNSYILPVVFIQKNVPNRFGHKFLQMKSLKNTVTFDLIWKLSRTPKTEID